MTNFSSIPGLMDFGEIELGIHDNPKTLLEAVCGSKCYPSDQAHSMFGSPFFTLTYKQCKEHLVGIPFQTFEHPKDGLDTSLACEHGKRFGLQLCSTEAGPLFMLLQKGDLKDVGPIIFAMQPVIVPGLKGTRIWRIGNPVIPRFLGTTELTGEWRTGTWIFSIPKN